MLLLQVIVGGLLLGAIYALFSAGLTLIWGMMNFINFAHGEFVMLGMYVALVVVTSMGGGPTIFSFVAAGLLATLGIGIYFALIRHVIRGPMMAQILSTFGLALLLRYTAFYVFSANVVSLPQNAFGIYNIGGILLPGAQLLAGIVAIVLTIALHLLLTRTFVGSRLLAVAEDRNAAMLMGIRPDRMQALAWGLAAASAGIAGSLMAMSYPWSPSVGETFGLTAFVVVTLGGFGSVPGALYAGTDHRPVAGAVGLLARADLQGCRGLRAVRGPAVASPAGPDGQGMRGERVKIGLPILALALLAYPFVLNRSLLSRHRRCRAAGGDLGVGLEHRRRLCRAGLGRPRHVLRRRRLCPAAGLSARRMAAGRRRTHRHRARACCLPW